MKNNSLKKFRIVFLIGIVAVLALLCCACNKDYEFEDAQKLLRRSWINAEYIGEGTCDDEKDTVWVYRDKKTGEEFQVIEDHYMTGIDASTWEQSRLYTNYSYVAALHYFNDVGVPDLAELKVTEQSGYVYKVILNYSFSNRDELKEVTKELTKVCRKMWFLNFNAKFDAYIYFNGEYFSKDISRVSVRKVNEAEKSFLVYVLAHYDEEQLAYYREAEIRDCVKNYRGRVYIVEGEDKMRPTNVISLAGNTFLYRNALRHLLIDEGYNVSGDEESFSVTFADGTVKKYEESDYSYIEIEKEFGIRLRQK